MIINEGDMYRLEGKMLSRESRGGNIMQVGGSGSTGQRRLRGKFIKNKIIKKKARTFDYYFSLRIFGGHGGHLGQMQLVKNLKRGPLDPSPDHHPTVKYTGDMTLLTHSSVSNIASECCFHVRGFAYGKLYTQA